MAGWGGDGDGEAVMAVRGGDCAVGEGRRWRWWRVMGEIAGKQYSIAKELLRLQQSEVFPAFSGVGNRLGDEPVETSGSVYPFLRRLMRVKKDKKEKKEKKKKSKKDKKEGRKEAKEKNTPGVGNNGEEDEEVGNNGEEDDEVGDNGEEDPVPILRRPAAKAPPALRRPAANTGHTFIQPFMCCWLDWLL